jgi:transposase InsO family protein
MKIRDEVVDFVNKWSKITEIAIARILPWVGLNKGKFHAWRDRYGKANEHNGKIPRGFWLQAWEKQAIIDFHGANPLNGYRRLSFMMLDANVVSASPSSVRNVLKSAGLLDRKWCKPSKKGTGFSQPSAPHKHWHIDVTYINIAGTFFYLTTVLDGYSRYIAHWEIKESMTEKEIELIIERARERFPGVSPRIISDNGPQFIAKDFKEYVRLCGMTHVRTSPFYPQSNGKIEAWHKTLKRECIRPHAPGSFGDAERYIAEFVDEYNNRRLHSGIGYIAPADKLESREGAIFVIRNTRLQAARYARRVQQIQEHEIPIGATEVPVVETSNLTPCASLNASTEAFYATAAGQGAELELCYDWSA